AALYYDRLGRCPYPAVHESKKHPSGLEGTNVRPLTGEELEAHFPEGEPRNVGLLLGQVRDRLLDVDLDCEEARRLAPVFRPPTNWVSGRAKAPQSHRWYECLGDLPGSRKYLDPVRKAKREKEERTVLVELRAGSHTLVPPSVHPNGETLVWHVHE